MWGRTTGSPWRGNVGADDGSPWCDDVGDGRRVAVV
jgi:hypothetical protein